MRKKVSVIVPVYNVEQYLAQCLDSLVNQTLQEIEILVINDGSKDNSQQIIETFQKKYPEKIRAFIKENGGLSDARNYGIDRAEGDFIAFVDSDDWAKENMLEQMYELAEKNGAEMVICNIQKVNEKGEIIKKHPQMQGMPECIELVEHFSVFSDLEYFACNKLFKKSLFEKHRFKKGVHFEDNQLVPQLLLKCKKIAHTEEYHYQYLEREGSISKTHNERGLDILRAVEEVEEVFSQSEYREKEIRGFLIFQGVYCYLAYLAYVRDEVLYREMSLELRKFMRRKEMSLLEILRYERFSQNYILSLPIKKQIYYWLYFLGQEWLIRKILR